MFCLRVFICKIGLAITSLAILESCEFQTRQHKKVSYEAKSVTQIYVCWGESHLAAHQTPRLLNSQNSFCSPHRIYVTFGILCRAPATSVKSPALPSLDLRHGFLFLSLLLSLNLTLSLMTAQVFITSAVPPKSKRPAYLPSQLHGESFSSETVLSPPALHV